MFILIVIGSLIILLMLSVVSIVFYNFNQLCYQKPKKKVDLTFDKKQYL